MKRPLFAAAAVCYLGILICACVKKDPLYCDESTPCEAGKRCNLPTHTCEPAADAGQDTGPGDIASQEKAPDVKLPDVGPPDGPAGDTGVDLPLPDLPLPDLPLPDLPLPDLLPPDLPKPDLGPVCPNGKKEAKEECDGTDLGGKTCKKLGFQCGTLKCQSNCTLDKTGCQQGMATALPGTVRAISSDGKGNTYVTGTFTAPATFGTTTLTGSNLFVTKLDSAGKVAWAVAPAGKVVDCTGIAVDASGNSYITGISDTTVTFGLSTIKYQGSCGNEVWIAKVKADGSFDWASFIGGPNSSCEYSAGIAVDNMGGVYASGYFHVAPGKTTFGTFSFSSVGYADGYVAKLDAKSGKFTWVSTLPGDSKSGIIKPRRIALDKVQNIYVVGEVWEGGSFDKGVYVNSAGVDDVFVTKLNSSGKPQWASDAGSTMSDEAAFIDIDSKGNSYITGTCSKGAKFGSTTLNTGFTARLNGNGAFTWAIPAAGTKVAVAKDNPYLVGIYSGSKTFGSTTLKATGGTDVYVARLDSTSGKFLSAVSGGGKSADKSVDAHADSAGNLYVSGSSTSPATFGSTTLKSGKSFVWKIPACALP